MKIFSLYGLVLLIALNVRGFRPGYHGGGSSPLVLDEYVGFPITYWVKIRESTDGQEGEQIRQRLVKTIPFHSYSGLKVVSHNFSPGAFLINLGIILVVAGVAMKLFYRYAW